MITNGMPILWIRINPTNLQYLIIIRFVGVKLDLRNNTQSVFACRTAIINLVTIAKFFHIIYNAVFMSLLTASQLERGLLGPISNYFATIEINGRGMLYLHYLV